MYKNCEFWLDDIIETKNHKMFLHSSDNNALVLLNAYFKSSVLDCGKAIDSMPLEDYKNAIGKMKSVVNYFEDRLFVIEKRNEKMKRSDDE